MHIPVLQKEVLQCLDPKPNENFIDCAIDGGGHSLAILEKIMPGGKILGIDWDEKIINKFRTSDRFKNNLILICDNFVNLEKIVQENNFQPVSGILFDLGMSSWHLEESGRGFSFRKEEPLDMRYNQDSSLTAKDIVNDWPEIRIEKILREYGEEKFAKSIVKEIVGKRRREPIKTTFQLVELTERAVPGWYRRRKIHPATRTFQALRIAVNDELDNLEKVLPQALKVLKPNGKLAVISFHSLEDRIVKNFFRQKEKENLLKILTKKPIKPSFEEAKANPRARAAKLRGAIKQLAINN